METKGLNPLGFGAGLLPKEAALQTAKNAS